MLQEGSRSVSQPKDSQGQLGLGKGHGASLECLVQAQPIHSAPFQAANAGAAVLLRCTANACSWHVTGVSADGPLGSASCSCASLHPLLPMTRTCAATSPDGSGALMQQSCPPESPRGLYWALQGPLLGPKLPSRMLRGLTQPLLGPTGGPCCPPEVPPFSKISKSKPNPL